MRTANVHDIVLICFSNDSKKGHYSLQWLRHRKQHMNSNRIWTLRNDQRNYDEYSWFIVFGDRQRAFEGTKFADSYIR